MNGKLMLQETPFHHDMFWIVSRIYVMDISKTNNRDNQWSKDRNMVQCRDLSAFLMQTSRKFSWIVESQEYNKSKDTQSIYITLKIN